MALKSILSYFQSFIPGNQLIDGGDLQALVKMLFGTTVGIVAHAGGNAAAGAQLSEGWNRVDTVASGGDSLRLPPAIAGAICGLWNNTGTSMQVFGQQANQGGLTAGDTIVPSNSNTPAAVATGVAQTTTQKAIYVCFVNGVWTQFLSA